MSANSTSGGGGGGGGGIGFAGLLTIVFIVLKLTGVIGWAWLWVLAPLWISLILGLAIFAAVILLVPFFGGHK